MKKDDIFFSILMICMVGVLIFISLVQPRDPCSGEFKMEECHVVEGIRFCKCCIKGEEEYTIVGDDFVKIKHDDLCKILKSLPSYWDEWYG